MPDEESALTAIGQIEDICPNCGTKLAKRPSRKTKCTACGKYIYARTRPIDRRQVLLTQEQADLVQQQWNIVTGVSDAFIYDQKLMDQTRKQLQSKLGRQVTENELKTAICELQQTVHAKEGDWGLYRNDRFQIAEFQRAAGLVSKALSTLLEVCYIDLNGPNNCGGLRQTPELLGEYPPFRPDPNGLAPGIIQRVQALTSYLKLSREELRTQFIEIAHSVRGQHSTPLDPDIAWNQFEPSAAASLVKG